jgi:hypothetical protein
MTGRQEGEASLSPLLIEIPNPAAAKPRCSVLTRSITAMACAPCIPGECLRKSSNTEPIKPTTGKAHLAHSEVNHPLTRENSTVPSNSRITEKVLCCRSSGLCVMAYQNV